MKIKAQYIAALIMLIIPFTSEAVFLLPEKNTPSKLIFTLNENEQFKFQQKLVNNTDQDIEVEIAIIDGIQDIKGNVSHKLGNEEQTMLGAWTTPQIQNIKIEANKEIPLEFTIKIPPNTLPGAYTGGISLISKKNDETKNGNIGGKAIVRFLKPISIFISGEMVHRVSINPIFLKINPNNLTLHFSFKNSGNSLVKIDIENELINKTLSTNQTIVKKGILSYPNTETHHEILLKKDFMGDFQGIIKIKAFGFIPSENKNIPILEEKYTLQFKIIPYNIINWLLIAFIGILLSATALLFRKILIIAGSSHYIVQKNETMEIIAKKFNVKWQKIAKKNKIKPPYTLNDGENITIPPSHIFAVFKRRYLGGMSKNK